MRRPAPSRLARFGRDDRGMAAIEFAMLAPIMLLLYFGMTEFSQAYMANRRANHTASIVADLVAQGETTSRAELTRIFDIGALVLKPFDAAPLSIRISSVTLDKDGKAVVDWSQSHGPGIPDLGKGEAYTNLPQGLITTGQSLIIGETSYIYASDATRVIKKPLAFNRSYYLRPRSSETIICSDC